MGQFKPSHTDKNKKAVKKKKVAVPLAVFEIVFAFECVCVCIWSVWQKGPDGSQNRVVKTLTLNE